MLSRIISSNLIESPRKLISLFFILCVFVSSCVTTPSSTPGVENEGSSQAAAADDTTPNPQELEGTSGQTGANGTSELFSSDRLGLCFSYPQGYTQIPYNDAVEISAPATGPGSYDVGLFWLEISDAQNRTAEEVADQEFTSVAGLNPGRWTVMLGGERALVLDGMPGQNLVRRVYVVRQQTLYILTFSPTRSGNQTASDQMEALYAVITGSWTWSPCSAGE